MAGTSRRLSESPYSQDQWAGLSAEQPVPSPRSFSERMNYPSFTGIIVATLLIAIPFVGFVALVVDVVMILRYVFGYRAPGSPQWSVHHPGVTGLVVVWVVAVLTVIAYPLAFYMTWRFIVEYQDQRRTASKSCPKCAETIKAAALVCRYCGQEFDPASIPQPATAAAATAAGNPAADREHSRAAKPYRRGVAYLIVGLAATLVLGLGALVFLGSQVDATLSGSAAERLPNAAGTSSALGEWPPSGFSSVGPGSSVAYRWLPVGSYQCESDMQSGCFGIDVVWRGKCAYLSVEMDTFDSFGSSTGVARASGTPSGSDARLIIPAPNARVTTGSAPTIICR